MRAKRFWILFVLCELLTTALSAQKVQKPEVQAAVRVIDGLKDRSLYDLAEIFIDDQLKAEYLNSIDKSFIVLEQIQVSVSKAITSTSDQRETAWNAASRIASVYQRTNPNHPRLLLVLVEDALVNLANGKLIQQEIAAEIVASDRARLALEQFRIATFKFSKIEKAIEKTIPVARNESTDDGKLSQQELINLKNNVHYRLAAIDLAKAQLFAPDDKLNRIDALNQVLFRLQEVITQSNAELPLWWNAHISKAKCLRLMKKPDQFNQLIERLPKKKINSQIVEDLLIERVQAAVDFGWNKTWIGLAKEFVKIQNPNPLLQLAALKMLMAEANRSDETVKKQRLTQATNLVKQIESSQGPYWGRRAEILLVGSVTPNAGDVVATSDFEILIRQGDAAFRKSNFADAIKAFSKASKFAVETERAQPALATTVRLAQCHEQLMQHQQAADRLFAVAVQFANAKSSDAVYLRDCWNLGKVTGSDEVLIGRLQNQIAQWPNSTSTDQARLWLGNAFQKQKNWEKATDAYLSLPFGSSLFPVALPQIDSCVTQWSANVREDGGDWKNENIKLGKMLHPKWQPIDQYNDIKQQLMVMFVKAGLSTNAMTPNDSWVFLELVTNESKIEPLPKTKVWKIIVEAKLSTDKQKLMDLIQQFPNDPKLLKECLLGLKKCLSKKELIGISDSIAMICNKATVEKNSIDFEFWEIEKAIAESQSKNSNSSIDTLAALTKRHPTSLRIQLAYARLLTKKSKDDAIHQWRRLAAKVKKESDPWYEAKYNVVELMVAAGQKEEAVKLVKYLAVTTASWKKSNWKMKFEKLVKK